MPDTPKSYNVHGIGVRVTGSEVIASCIDRRLSAFGAQSLDNPLISCSFNTVDSRHIDPIKVEEQPRGRPVYELLGGDLLYDPCQDEIFGSYKNSVRMRCNISAGTLEYAVLDNEEAIRVATQILFTLPLLELLRRQALFNIHAAGLCRGGRVILIAGSSGAGKSTLALAMTRAGWDFMGDDMLFLTKSPECIEALGFPEGIDYSEGSQLIGGLPEFKLPPFARKASLRPDLAFHSRIITRAKPCALVFPRVAYSPTSLLKPVTPADAFLSLVPNVLLTKKLDCQRHFELLKALTDSIPAFALETGLDLDSAVRLLESLIPRELN